MSTRKRWKTVTRPGGVPRIHDSERKAYEFIRGLATDYHLGVTRAETVVVWVSEAGSDVWQRYEHVSLAELATRP